MRANSEHYYSIVESAQVSLGCTEEQAKRLAKSACSDLCKLPDLPVETKRRKSTKAGLASITFTAKELEKAGIPHSPALRLVRLLQMIDDLRKKNRGVHPKATFQLANELDAWLRRSSGGA
jgi:hypothetical protein